MRKFVVNVNGNRYEVDVEEVGVSVPAVPAMGTATAAAPASTAVETPAAPAATAPAPAQRAESAPAPQAAPSGVAGSIEITSPMPGNILDIKVNTGESVKKGTVIAILEAMKMENEILAPKDAVVASIDVSRNQQVNSGDVIMTLKLGQLGGLIDNGVEITETVLRDAHQSLVATRMTTDDMLPIVEKLDQVGYHSLECWRSHLRFMSEVLNEDPWERFLEDTGKGEKDRSADAPERPEPCRIQALRR